MNDDILIKLGEVSEETKGCPGQGIEDPVFFTEYVGTPPCDE